MSRYDEMESALLEIIEEHKKRSEEEEPTTDCLPVSTDLVEGEVTD